MRWIQDSGSPAFYAKRLPPEYRSEIVLRARVKTLDLDVDQLPKLSKGLQGRYLRHLIIAGHAQVGRISLIPNIQYNHLTYADISLSLEVKMPFGILEDHHMEIVPGTVSCIHNRGLQWVETNRTRHSSETRATCQQNFKGSRLHVSSTVEDASAMLSLSHSPQTVPMIH